MNTEELLRKALAICQRVIDKDEVDQELLRIVFMQLTIEKQPANEDWLDEYTLH